MHWAILCWQICSKNIATQKSGWRNCRWIQLLGRLRHKQWIITSGGLQDTPPTKFQYAGPGQLWTEAKARVNSFGMIGICCFCQLITATREFRREVSPPLSTIFQNDYYGQTVLDNGAPNNLVYTPPNIAQNKIPTWQLGAKGRMSDSPGQSYSLDSSNNWIFSEAVDQMETWFMYRPPSVDSLSTVWIPLAKYSWGWSGQVSRPNPNVQWSQLSGSGSQTSHWTSTFEFPVWTNRLQGLINYHGL